MQSSIKLVAALTAFSCAVFGVASERSAAQEQPCPPRNFPDQADDFTMFDADRPGADTRIQDESDIDIKFRWFSDLDNHQDDGHYVTYAIRNLEEGENAGLIFLWTDAELSRPTTSPLRSLASLTVSKCFETRPTRQEGPIRYSTSLARNVTVPTYAPRNATNAGKERAAWARMATDFLDDVGEVIDVIFEIRSKFKSDKITYSITAKPVDMAVGIGQLANYLSEESIALAEKN